MMTDPILSQSRHNTPVVEIHDTELSAISGGDWGDTMWGIMLGGAATAGFLGSGGLLLVAAIAGGIILLEDVPLPG